MKEELHFNMGGFDSTRLHNDDAPAQVPAHVVYACASFIHHVVGSGEPFLGELRSWAKNSFLFWLEVMGLSYKARQGCDAMTTLKEHSQVIHGDLVLYTMLTRWHTAG
jgi:SOS-response transcriptional repressor LexA